jgi:hypothetical protein
MAIIRAKKKTNFTMINNAVFERGGLSFQAMGVLCYLLSKPDGWKISTSELQKVTEGTAKKTGRDGVYSILGELKNCGFVVVKKKASGEVDYIVSDEPDTFNADEAKPDPAKPDPAKPTQVNTDLKVNKDLKEKNTKKENLDFSPLGFTDEQVEEFKRLRKHTKAMITQRVINTTGKQLDLSRQAGYSNDQILDVWVSKGWRSYEHQWFLNALQAGGAAVSHQPQAHKAMPDYTARSLDIVRNMEWDDE